MIRRPPISPLSPSPTLSRPASTQTPPPRFPRTAPPYRPPAIPPCLPPTHCPESVSDGAASFPVASAIARPLHPATAPADRKSTRLNSSHSQISYAVFCLQKK